MAVRSYYKDSQKDRISQMVEDYAPLVKKIALHLRGRLPASVQLDDLIQSGMLGLLDAVNNFDASKGASFETFATFRIRGAMIDDLRNTDWAPRSVHHNTRMIAEAISVLAKTKGRDPTDDEVATYLGMEIREYHTKLYEASVSRISAIEDLGVPAEALLADGEVGDDSPLSSVIREKYTRAMGEAIEKLPRREALVFSLYYREELNLKEIGLVLDVTESRGSQILSQAIVRLRTKLKDWM